MTFAGKNLGRDGENVAAYFLKQEGYEILERNFAYKGGEIDVIAKKQDALHFIEVKTRKVIKYGTPAMAVNQKKQEKIFNTAAYYLSLKKISDIPCSFDVIEVFKFNDGRFAVNHIENAFEG